MNIQKLPTRLLAGMGATVVCAALVVFAPVHAEIYKCISADGSTTYNDAPCAATDSTHLLSKSARAVESLDCRIARNFAIDTVARMRQKESASDVFEAYGGAREMSEGARDLVNFAYSYEADPFVSAQQIVNLTIERCQAGLLGKTLSQCETYPKDFIERFGSCINARATAQSGQISAPNNEDFSQAKADGQATDTPTLQAANAELSINGNPDNASGADTVADDLPKGTGAGPDIKAALPKIQGGLIK